MASEVYLLDVNTLIALTWPNHVHHEQAHRWFEGHAAAGWATCPLTQCAFVRISSNKGLIPEGVVPVHAQKMLKELTAHPTHRFWADDVDFSIAIDIPLALLQGYRQVTDAYLLLLARGHHGRLATLDTRLFHAVEGTDWEKYLTLLET